MIPRPCILCPRDATHRLGVRERYLNRSTGSHRVRVDPEDRCPEHAAQAVEDGRAVSICPIEAAA